MKKIITTLLIAAMLTGTLAGCRGGASSDTASDGENSAPAAEEKSPAVRLLAMFNAFPDYFGAGGMAMAVAAPDVDAVKEMFPDPVDPERPTHCVEVIEEGENGILMLQLTQLNPEDCEDYIMAVSLNRLQLKRIAIVKPKEGREEAVKTALSEYAEVSKNPPSGSNMGYPDWEEERAGTHFGETSDGCFYVVVAAEGAEMGAAIENA